MVGLLKVVKESCAQGGLKEVSQSKLFQSSVGSLMGDLGAPPALGASVALPPVRGGTRGRHRGSRVFLQAS